MNQSIPETGPGDKLGYVSRVFFFQMNVKQEA